MTAVPPIERLPDLRRPHGCPGRSDRVGSHDEYRGPCWADRDPHVGHCRLVGVAQQFAVGASVRSGVHLNPGALSQVHVVYFPPGRGGMPRQGSPRMRRACWELLMCRPDTGGAGRTHETSAQMADGWLSTVDGM